MLEVNRVKDLVRQLILPDEKHRNELPLSGYTPGTVPSRFLDSLSDEELTSLNETLRWNCFTVDGRGRRVGSRAKVGKRDTPNEIPDRRIVTLHERVNLADKSVLELGCFEGVHTVGLCQYSPDVTAVDVRIENVVKTVVRSWCYGTTPKVFVSNVDSSPLDPQLPEADVCFHCGVLYHLADPVLHLLEVLPRVKKAILLDTHYARPGEADGAYEVHGKNYPFRNYKEDGMANVFAGAKDHAKWLPLDTITDLLVQSGFRHIERLADEVQRNGPRVTFIARR